MLPPAASFEQLEVWQTAHEYVKGIYATTSDFPKSETYGLTQQMRRAAVSIPANIAEGFRRRGKADKVRFLNIAEGSLAESTYYLLLAQDLGYADTTQLKGLLDRVSKMLHAYSAAILRSMR